MPKLTASDPLVGLFDNLRNGHDHGQISNAAMQAVTSVIVTDLSNDERDQMLAARKLNPKHLNKEKLSLRETLNKIAHCERVRSTYRVDGR